MLIIKFLDYKMIKSVEGLTDLYYSKDHFSEALPLPEVDPKKNRSLSRQVTLRDVVEVRKKEKKPDTRPVTPKKKKMPVQKARQSPRLNLE